MWGLFSLQTPPLHHTTVLGCGATAGNSPWTTGTCPWSQSSSGSSVLLDIDILAILCHWAVTGSGKVVIGKSIWVIYSYIPRGIRVFFVPLWVCFFQPGILWLVSLGQWWQSTGSPSRTQWPLRFRVTSFWFFVRYQITYMVFSQRNFRSVKWWNVVSGRGDRLLYQVRPVTFRSKLGSILLVSIT